ncbi:MAG: hypothetical protein HYZ28_01560 [Myxococcales bacterium]|nr:hypothetical protein [Myxococcales bacterium]
MKAASRGKKAPKAAKRPLRPAAVVRASGMETLESAYQAWAELKLRHQERAAAIAAERKGLEEHGAFIVGTVRAASETHPPAAEAKAISKRDQLTSFLRDAEKKLEAARRQLDRKAEQESSAFARGLAEVETELRGRIERTLSGVRPKLRLTPHPLGPDRRLLHLDRLSADEGVLLLYVLSGKLPSRHDFLSDDSTEDVGRPPAPLYPEEGVGPEETRPNAEELAQRLRGLDKVWPVKGFVPLFLPGGFYRMLQRGPVMEVEVQEGPAFRNVLTGEEAESVAGYLLRLKLEGLIELEIAG